MALLSVRIVCPGTMCFLQRYGGVHFPAIVLFTRQTLIRPRSIGKVIEYLAAYYLSLTTIAPYLHLYLGYLLVLVLIEISRSLARS